MTTTDTIEHNHLLNISENEWAYPAYTSSKCLFFSEVCVAAVSVCALVQIRNHNGLNITIKNNRQIWSFLLIFRLPGVRLNTKNGLKSQNFRKRHWFLFEVQKSLGQSWPA